MKTIKNHFYAFFFLSAISLVTFLSSCEGPMGQDGEDGGLVYADVYEIEGDFTSDNGYRFGYTFPSSIYESDVVLVYILWEQSDGMDVWRLLPQTVVTEDGGVLIYNSDYTYVDVQVFLEFTFDENYLLSSETDNQIFRIVVVPSDYAALKSVDYSDINSIINNPEIKVNMTDEIKLDINSNPVN